jgi:ubiquinone/menaquinone biosynthesis C-methylase UbiE
MLFNELGIQCSGSDISLDMIKKAQENCNLINVKCNLFQADFRNLQDDSNNSLDLIINLGNSLAYLNKPKDFSLYFKGCTSKLNKGGIMIIETRNYDLLMKQKPRFIPLSFRDNYGFIYVLDYLKNRIRFNVLYFNLQTHDFQTFETVYFPLFYENLIKYIKESGFEVKEQYSNYKFEQFDLEQSYDLILILKRKV